MSVTLAKMLQQTFPDKYAGRLEEQQMDAAVVASEAEAAAERDEDPSMPLFVLDPILPGQTIHLHVFEPRYKEMISRCLETGQRRFGMVGPDHLGDNLGALECGTEVEIEESEPLPQGRYNLQVVGRRVFRLQGLPRSNELGLLTASVRFLHLEGEATQQLDPETLEQSEQLGVLVERWQQLVVEARMERWPNQLSQTLRSLGAMPGTNLPSQRALYVAALVNPIPALGVAPEIRPPVLLATTALERFQVVNAGIQDSIDYLSKCKSGKVLFFGLWLPGRLVRFVFVTVVLAVVPMLLSYGLWSEN